MADRIFTYLGRSIQELNELKNEYTNLFQRHSVPWSNVVKIMFRAQLKLLQESMTYWDECITKLENKAKNMRNDDEEKQQLLDKIDEHNNDAGHRLLKREVSKILLEGQGYLELEQPTNAAANIPPPTLSTPNVNIQKFDGDYLKWRSFKERFDHSVHHKAYPNVEKMIALLGLLEGDALAEVQGFEVSNANYNSVYQALEERFGNNQVLIRKLQTNLRSVQPATQEAKSIRETVNAVTNMVRQLKNLNVNINNESMILDVIEKMPKEERIKLRYFSMSTKDVTIEQILHKMKEMAFKAEIAADDEKEHCSRRNRDSDARKSQSFFQSTNFQPSNNIKTNNSNKNFTCSFCDDDHSSVRCPKFVSNDERIKQLKTKDCCTKCTKPNHNESQCESNIVCRICQGHHYSFLCKQWNNTNYQKSNNSNTFITIEAQQGCLLTKKVRVSNPVTNEKADATLLFDPGSQRSFVSDRLIRQLKLPWEAKERLELQGIGAKATNYVSTKVKLQIKTSESFKHIFANSIPKIANAVSLVTFDENDLTKITTTETIPDILIGMDYFFTFITSFERKNDVVIVHSEVGQMLSGKIQTSQNNTVSTLAIEKEKTKFNRKPSYWKLNAMGSYQRKETNTQDGRMQKHNEETKPPQSKQLHNLKRLHRPRTFYNSNISLTIKSLIVGKQILLNTEQEKEKVQCELKTNNLSGGGEYPAEIITSPSRKPPKRIHQTYPLNGERSSMELEYDNDFVTRRAINNLYPLEETIRSVDLEIESYAGGRECRGERE